MGVCLVMFNGASIEQKPSGHDRVRESIDFTVGGNDIRVRGDWQLAGETCLRILGRRLPPRAGQLSSVEQATQKDGNIPG